ncbi:MAG: type IV pilus biogenesis/stability protein PilW [Pasteurellaceae bacterium]|nr:type IV pilus biogenesis/stability protein PilW [Pasteurellaceae bacterium]
MALLRSVILFSMLLMITLLSACVSQTSQIDFDKQQAAKARIELGLGYLNQQNFAQAKLNLDKAFHYDPNYYLVHSALAYYYQQRGDIANARAAYQKAIELDDKQGDSHNNYATFLCGQQEYAAAYQQFDLALQLPHYYRQADTLENIVLCAKTQPNKKRYQESLQKLSQLDAKRATQLRQLNQP